MTVSLVVGFGQIKVNLLSSVSIYIILRPCFHVIASQNTPGSPVPFVQSGEPGNEATSECSLTVDCVLLSVL